MKFKHELLTKPNVDKLGDKYHPKISFDSNSNYLVIEGSSLMENALAFYQPLLEWLDEYERWLHELTSRKTCEKIAVRVVIDVDVLNSGSMKYLFILLSKIDGLGKYSGVNVSLDWYYEEEDEISEELGVEMNSIFSMDFTMYKNQN